MTKATRRIEPTAHLPVKFEPEVVEAEQKGFITKVKEDGGYGFVRGEDGEDYFFRLSVFKGLGKDELPTVGRYVNFTPQVVGQKQLGKAPRIRSLSYDPLRADEGRLPKDQDGSGRVRCPHCGYMMHPWLRLGGESDDGKKLKRHTICPICLQIYSQVEEKPSYWWVVLLWILAGVMAFFIFAVKR